MTDHLQFARLLAEIRDSHNLNYTLLANNLNLSEEELREQFHRAELMCRNALNPSDQDRAYSKEVLSTLRNIIASKRR